MDYRKPSKAKANETYLLQSDIGINDNPYNSEAILQKKLFLIVCEGENTEPCYFKSFPVPTKTVIVEGGCGSKTSLVDFAIDLAKRPEYLDREVWCVFDFDIKPDEKATQPEDFNNAIEKAESQGLHVAWSNDAFELWFVLHFQELDAALTRHELYPILKGAWKLESFSREAKKFEFCQGHYERHGGTESDSQQLAIRRAKRLHSQYDGKKDFANQCPCTTVYQLVIELNNNLKA